MAGQSGCAPHGSGHGLGTLKYGLCALLAVMTFAVAAPLFGAALASVASLLAFYALESRWVFVFPAAAHGDPSPFRSAWRLVKRHGGTLAAMRIVLPLAAFMLSGGWRGHGFVRSWCIGCLAVFLWYRALTKEVDA